MSDVTRILSEIEQGDQAAAEQLLPLVYAELRQLAAQRMSHEPRGQTIQATALVHEAYMRLVGQHWEGRGHFFAAAAEAMRRILVERARSKSRLKRGGGYRKLDLEQIEFALDSPADDLIMLNEALDQLADEDELCSELVKLRFFAGLGHGEAARVMGIPRRTADRHWEYARAWLYEKLSGESS